MIIISSVVALLPLVVTYVNGGSFYHLLNTEKDIETDSTSSFLFNKKFYACDREESCTHVAKELETNSFVMVYGENDMKKLRKTDLIWAKIKQVRKSDKVINKGMN